MFFKTLFLLPVVMSLTRAFPSGAHNNGSNPMDALSSYCTAGNFRPNHGTYLPQASASPYVIKVTSPTGLMYSPNRVVTITIEGKPTAPGLTPKKIKGFFLQGDSTEGAFAGDIVCTKNQGKAVTFCSKQGVTHTNAVPKSKLVCQWTPPDFQLGQVQFTATVLENFTHFWTGVKSGVTMHPDPTTMTYTQKAQQLSSNLMKQFQGASQNLLNMFKQSTAGNQMSSLFGGSTSSNNNANANNPLAAMMSNFNKNGASNQLASMFGGNTNTQQGDTSSYWRSAGQGNQGTNQGFDLSNFQQFFQR